VTSADYDKCFWVLCLVDAPSPVEDHIFGFGEFVGAVALLIVFFQIVDYRYRFRLAVLPSYLLWSLFVVVLFIGFGILLMQLWLAEGWTTLASPISPAMWEAIFASLFLIALLWVTYYAFLRPPRFSKRNALRFARAMYRAIEKGDDAELSVLADELSYSAYNLIKLCASPAERPKAKPYSAIAYDVILLIANRKFCRHIVASAQSTAIALCECTTSLRRYDVPIGPFCEAVSVEAIENKDSILHHETEEYASDLLGTIRPWTKALYGDYQLIRSMEYRSPLNIRLYRLDREWKIDEWRAFTKIVLASIQGYLDSEYRDARSFAIGGAIDQLKWLTMRLAQYDESVSFFDSDNFERLTLATDFYKSVIETIDSAKRPMKAPRRARDHAPRDLFDDIAKLAYEVLLDTTRVKGSRDVMWGVQHNTAWTSFFERHAKSESCLHVVRARIARLLFEEISKMRKHGPNYVGVRVVGLVLNILGLKGSLRRDVSIHERAIHAIALRWAAENYLTLRSEYPDVADALLIGSLDFDEHKSVIRKTYASWLGKPGSVEELTLKPALSGPTNEVH
jgi:hypothetical protein